MGKLKQIRLLQVIFNLKIKFSEIRFFRGAVIKTTQGKNNLFHNHSPEGNIYRYPKIQYKLINGSASLLCVEEGIEGIQEFFSQTDWKLKIENETREIKVENIKVHQHRVAVWENWFDYKITNWLPLNQENYTKYKALEDLTERINFLEKIMLANILSFLQGIDLYVDEKIEVKIKSIRGERLMNYKDQQMQAFTLVFRTNVSLPNFIGLGKGSSSGFGVIKEIEKKRNQ
jgi:hypothetical protein